MSTNSDRREGSALSEGLGPLPEDELRQQAFLILSRLQSGTEEVVRLDAALAAVAAERERCAKLCEDTDDRMHHEAQECNGYDCARAIRGA